MLMPSSCDDLNQTYPGHTSQTCRKGTNTQLFSFGGFKTNFEIYCFLVRGGTFRVPITPGPIPCQYVTASEGYTSWNINRDLAKSVRHYKMPNLLVL